jgi:hypothetical protein
MPKKDGQKTSTRRRPVARKAVGETVEFAGNQWFECLGATEPALAQLEREIEKPLPRLVRELLAKCAGGCPVRPYFFSEKHDIEVGVGYVLPVDPGNTKRTSVTTAREYISADDLIPFGVDNGNANFFCLTNEGKVMYRPLDEIPRASRMVADSLSEFIEGLAQRPF